MEPWVQRVPLSYKLPLVRGEGSEPTQSHQGHGSERKDRAAAWNQLSWQGTRMYDGAKKTCCVVNPWNSLPQELCWSKDR